jgi:polysaccharide export outer membrane protein
MDWVTEMTFYKRLSILLLAWTFAIAGVCSAQDRQPEHNSLFGTDYLVGHDDVLSIEVWSQPSLSGKFTVDADGSFTFPLIGRVSAAGLTASQVGESLAKRLEAGYVKQPHVSVAVEHFRSRQILVTGEVKQPGRYSMTGRSTVLEALAQAGSPMPTAGSEVIVLRRAEPSGNVIRVNLVELEAGVLTDNIEVMDGDTIVVPKAEQVYVFGQVRSPGSYAIRKGTTILQALALAGGLTDRGSDRRVRVVRATANGGKEERRVALQDIVQGGDSIIVEERVF